MEKLNIQRREKIMAVKASRIIAIVISLLLMGVLLPIGLDDILGFTSDDSTVQTLVATVIPILAVVSLIMMMIPRNSNSN